MDRWQWAEKAIAGAVAQLEKQNLLNLRAGNGNLATYLATRTQLSLFRTRIPGLTLPALPTIPLLPAPPGINGRNLWDNETWPHSGKVEIDPEVMRRLLSDVLLGPAEGRKMEDTSPSHLNFE